MSDMRGLVEIGSAIVVQLKEANRLAAARLEDNREYSEAVIANAKDSTERSRERLALTSKEFRDALLVHVADAFKGELEELGNATVAAVLVVVDRLREEAS